jgi:hypothetical protein
MAQHDACTPPAGREADRQVEIADQFDSLAEEAYRFLHWHFPGIMASVPHRCPGRRA